MDIEGKIYYSKGDLLRSLGKNGGDNKLVDRMIGRGEVYVEGSEYHYIGKVDVRELVLEIKRLREKGVDKGESGTKYLAGKEKKGNQAENTGLEVLKEEINSLKKTNESLNGDLEYQIEENEKLEERVAMFQECIRRCYIWAREVKKDKTPRPEFKEKVLKLGETLPGEENQ